MQPNDNQLKLWTEEQYRVASNVVILNQSSFTTKHPISTKCTEYRQRYNHYKITPNLFQNPFLIGGVDVAFPKDPSQPAIAVYVILSYSNFDTPPSVIYRRHTTFSPPPYIPSYLSFRESPPLLSLISQQLETRPEIRPRIIMVDGNGIWHERRAGLACFIGQCGIPCIGVGKTWYSMNGKDVDGKKAAERSLRDWDCWFGERTSDDKCVIFDSVDFSDEESTLVSNEARNGSVLLKDILSNLYSVAYGLAIPMHDETDSDNIMAYALVGHGGRDQAKSSKHARGSKNPIYISIGDNISLQDAVLLVTYTCGVGRIPEPVREADLYGRELLRNGGNDPT